MARAAHVGRDAGCDHVVITSDIPIAAQQDDVRAAARMLFIHRPAELAQDDTPMISVVTHALEQIPGEPDDIIVLLQPTAPFRKPEHIREAIRLLRDTSADSVVSVVPLPLTHSPEFQCVIYAGPHFPEKGRLAPYPVHEYYEYTREYFSDQPTRRQGVEQTYIRDGTVYAFWRKTVGLHRNIYGRDVRPLIIDPADSCELDTEADWATVERRWNERTPQ